MLGLCFVAWCTVSFVVYQPSSWMHVLSSAPMQELKKFIPAHELEICMEISHFCLFHHSALIVIRLCLIFTVQK